MGIVHPGVGDGERSDCYATREQFSDYQQSRLGLASGGPARETEAINCGELEADRSGSNQILASG